MHYTVCADQSELMLFVWMTVEKNSKHWQIKDQAVDIQVA